MTISGYVTIWGCSSCERTIQAGAKPSCCCFCGKPDNLASELLAVVDG